MMRTLRRLWRAERGSALIEFAMLSPLTVMFIMASLEFGSAMKANAGLRELAGDAGRTAMVEYQLASDGYFNNATLKSKIVAAAATKRYNLNSSDLTVNVTSKANTALLTVLEITVALQYDYHFSLPFLPNQTIDMDVSRTFYVPNPASNSF